MSDDKTIIAESPNLTILSSPKRKTACLVQYSGARLGKRYPLTEPANVVGTIELLAEIRGWTVDEARERVYGNYVELFGTRWGA